MANNKQTPSEIAAETAAQAAEDASIGIQRSLKDGFRVGSKRFTNGEVNNGTFAAAVVAQRAAAASAVAAK